MKTFILTNMSLTYSVHGPTQNDMSLCLRIMLSVGGSNVVDYSLMFEYAIKHGTDFANLLAAIGREHGGHSEEFPSGNSSVTIEVSPTDSSLNILVGEPNPDSDDFTTQSSIRISYDTPENRQQLTNMFAELRNICYAVPDAWLPPDL